VNDLSKAVVIDLEATGLDPAEDRITSMNAIETKGAGEDVTVLYHGGGRRDGFCAAWCLRMVFPAAEFLAVNYGQRVPSVTNRRLFVVDFSYPANTLLQLAEQNKSILVIDHHESAREELERASAAGVPVLFYANHSGAGLAWRWVFDNLTVGRRQPIPVGREMCDRDNPPWLVCYVEDRDLWRWALHDSRAINASIRLTDLSFEAWDALAFMNPVSLVERGEAVLMRDAEIVATHVKHAVPKEIGGYTVPAVNATTLMSEIGEALSDGQPFAATYFDDLKAGKRRWSLRSQPEGIDVGEVAKTLGGGGHRHAAGFEMPLPDQPDDFDWIDAAALERLGLARCGSEYTHVAFSTGWSDPLDADGDVSRLRLVVLPKYVRLEEELIEGDRVLEEWCTVVPRPQTVGDFRRLCAMLGVPPTAVAEDERLEEAAFGAAVAADTPTIPF
jgi:uncharacterized protein